MIRSSSGFSQRIQLRAGWSVARLGDVGGVVAVEEEREVGVTAPGLDGPGDVGLVVAGCLPIPGVTPRFLHFGRHGDAGLAPHLGGDRAQPVDDALGRTPSS